MGTVPDQEMGQPAHNSQGLTNWVCVWDENISQKLGEITPFEIPGNDEFFL
jgi:hypothetical protein